MGVMGYHVADQGVGLCMIAVIMMMVVIVMMVMIMVIMVVMMIVSFSVRNDVSVFVF